MPVQAANASVEGDVSVEVELKLPNNKFIPIADINITYVSSSITENVKGISSHELTLRAPTTDYVDTVIRALQSLGTPTVRYRIGTGLPGQMVFLPWQDQIVTNLTAVLEGVGETAGHFVRMEMKDTLFTMSRATKTTSHRGKVSDIVQAIATANGFSNTVIEPTVGDGLWIQSFVDDENFVRQRMVHRAVNAKGRGCYNFYVQDNALHFHSPDYQAQLKQLVYYEANNIGLSQLDESQHMLEFGASGVRLIAFDPYSGQMGEVLSDPTKALRLGNVITPLTNVQGADLNYPFHISTNSIQEAQNIAQTVYENARMQTLGLKLSIARSIFLRVGDLVQIAISPSGGKNSVWSGVYYVSRSSYRIEGGVMVSAYVIQRGEYQTSNQTPTSVTLLGNNLVVSDQQAPGQPLNVKVAESSVLAHGAGRASYTSIYVDTQNASTAPNPNPAF